MGYPTIPPLIDTLIRKAQRVSQVGAGVADCEEMERARQALEEEIDAVAQRAYLRGTGDGQSRARNRPGDGDMGG